MKIDLSPGKYVLAVSGGVDSVVLLDLLHSKFHNPNSQFHFIIAHYDHGIRPGSSADRKFVEKLAAGYGLEFVYEEGRLGPSASEEQARKSRYGFLNRAALEHAAKAVITAHHRDDVLETAIINILRGTGPRGLASLRSDEALVRPLLGKTKAELLAYANDKGLEWREDESNRDITYLRNYVRHKIVPRLAEEHKQALRNNIETARSQLENLDAELPRYFHMHHNDKQLDRYLFIMLPHSAAREVMAYWLRKNGVRDLSKKMIERLVVAAKTYEPGKRADIDKNKKLRIHKSKLELLPDKSVE